ncbi:MAG: hypothetical protein FJW40_05755 [Acidobacteria bacterium]|nr:hypothetical protein [Acidobacteriota bacterium]
MTLWFDTEDYVEPSDDEATLRLARDLTALGVRATFKVVGEKARVLEQRKRQDVIRALAAHDIGYHSNYHSFQPTPAVYMNGYGLLDGAREFERRELPGVRDIERIWGVTPSSYGQPGSSWGPQSNIALRRMGIPVYLDEGSHVTLRDQPFFYGGLLYVFGIGRYVFRPSLEDEAALTPYLARFDAAAAELRAKGGGLISSYYHPNEWVTTEFWDGVNFSRGAFPERADWKRPKTRTPEATERAFRIFRRYVEHALKVPGVRFITAREFHQIYASREGAAVDRPRLAAHFQHGINFYESPETDLSAAEVLLQLLGLPAQHVDGPSQRWQTSVTAGVITRAQFDRAREDVVSYIRFNRMLPPGTWVATGRLSLPDFAATLAFDDGRSPSVTIHKGAPLFEKQVSTEPKRHFNWVIHPEDFDGSALHELGRLQAWTLKPARLR